MFSRIYYEYNLLIYQQPIKISNINKKTYPQNVLNFLFVHSFEDHSFGEDDKGNWLQITLPTFFDYPNISKTALWNQFREQRITTINFFHLLKTHAFSTFKYNTYIIINIILLHLFNVLTLFCNEF